jgi:hypothetical protein
VVLIWQGLVLPRGMQNIANPQAPSLEPKDLDLIGSTNPVAVPALIPTIHLSPGGCGPQRAGSI